MAQSHVLTGAGARAARPIIRKIGPADLLEALRKGYDDLAAIPSYGVFLCLIYPVAGIILWRLAIGYDVIPLLFPLTAGFALIGPFAALGLYELSRRREQGSEYYGPRLRRVPLALVRPIAGARLLLW